MTEKNKHYAMFVLLSKRLGREVKDLAVLSYVAASWGINSEILERVINSGVVLRITDCGDHKLLTIRAIRDILNFDLKNAKRMADGLCRISVAGDKWRQLKLKLDDLNIEYQDEWYYG